MAYLSKAIHKQDTKQSLTYMIPSYYTDFACIGGRCEDTCCAGWQITIDEKTYNKYKKVKHVGLGKQFAKDIVRKKLTTDTSSFAKVKLKNNRCAFLTEDGWCHIYNELGESYLSKTCAEYPRTCNKVGEVLEYSLTPSCPEATRQIICRKEGICFDETTQAEPLTVSATITIHETHKESWRDAYRAIRGHAIAILQDRAQPFETRLLRLGTYFKWVDSCAQTQNLESLQEMPAHLDTDDAHLLAVRPMLELAILLKQLFKDKKDRIARYQCFLDQVLQGLSLDQKINFQEAKAAYEQGEASYTTAILEAHPYFLENYFVNYMYERCMPLDGQTTYESYKRMLLYYYLIKVHLIGLAGTQVLDEAAVVQTIQLFTKTYDHGENYIQRVQEGFMYC